MEAGRLAHAVKRHVTDRGSSLVVLILPPERNVDAVLETALTTHGVLNAGVQLQILGEQALAHHGKLPSRYEVWLIVEVNAVETRVGRRLAVEADDGIYQPEDDVMAFVKHICWVAIERVDLDAAAMRITEQLAPAVLMLEPGLARQMPGHLDPGNVDRPRATELEKELAG